MSYSGEQYGGAWIILERKFVKPCEVIEAKPERLWNANQVNPPKNQTLSYFDLLFIQL